MRQSPVVYVCILLHATSIEHKYGGGNAYYNQRRTYIKKIPEHKVGVNNKHCYKQAWPVTFVRVVTYNTPHLFVLEKQHAKT